MVGLREGTHTLTRGLCLSYWVKQEEKTCLGHSAIWLALKEKNGSLFFSVAAWALLFIPEASLSLKPGASGQSDNSGRCRGPHLYLSCLSSALTYTVTLSPQQPRPQPFTLCPHPLNYSRMNRRLGRQVLGVSAPLLSSCHLSTPSLPLVRADFLFWLTGWLN